MLTATDASYAASFRQWDLSLLTYLLTTEFVCHYLCTKRPGFYAISQPGLMHALGLCLLLSLTVVLLSVVLFSCNSP